MTRHIAISLVGGMMAFSLACNGGASSHPAAGGGGSSVGLSGGGTAGRGGSANGGGQGGIRGSGGGGMSGFSSGNGGLSAGGGSAWAGSHGGAGGTGAGGSGGAGGSPGPGDAGSAGASGSGGQTGSGGSGAVDAGGFATVEIPKPVNGASTVPDSVANGGVSISLGKTGQGGQITGLPAAGKLAIHYASVSVGTISVSVNSGTAVKVNVHSSGALTGSFLYAIITIAIPANASVTVSQASGDVAVNIDEMIVGDGDLGLPPDIWNLPAFQPASGPYAADWTKLGLAYSVPEWWRDAKFGAWAHWDPQSEPEQGDWYAYHMYQEGSADFNYQVAHYGDPGGSNPYGYKDLCENWKIDLWDPSSLMDLYVQMGAKFFMAMGSHHDNFANYDSVYQEWNSVNLGVKQDIVATWAPLARQAGLRFAIGFHNTPARTWGQWMPIRYTSDAKGPYDALNTILDGKGKWWEGMDPVNLYGYQHTTDCSNDSCNSSPYGTQFMYRIDEAIEKYHPDYIYFDDQAGPDQVDLGVHMGLYTIAPQILANFYNKSLSWNQGKLDVVMTMKGVGPGPDLPSFQANDPIVPYVERALVRCSDHTESDISAYPFLTDWDIQDGNWHYMTGAGYYDAVTMVTTLMQNVSRNGSLVLNLTQHGRGNLDPQPIQVAQDIGAWLKVNGEAVYSSRPFEVSGDDTVQYTRANGNVYATLFGWNGGAVTLKALASGGATIGNVSKVELLGSTVAMSFVQNGSGLTVTPSGSVPALSGISNQQVASGVRSLRITHDKGWFNDDDPGATTTGWLRTVNLGTGDYNNDLTTSSNVGDTWTATLTGTGVMVYAPKQSGYGQMDIQIDGQSQATADLSTSGARQAQQMVAQVTGLASGQHTISIVNRGPGSVAVDALVVQQ
ncbi:MAG: alpha-L-fucosidase [Polyangia bacterium]